MALVKNGYCNSSDSPTSRTLVWSDEFNGPAGQSPDSARWAYDIGTDWGNAQLEYDTDRPSNVSLNGYGNLAITAHEEFYMGQPYTSARIVTRGLFEPMYGRVETRINLPTGQGIWPAFWMLGSDIGTAGWPQCGEIDIMEYRGQETSIIHGSLHGPGYSGGDALTQSYMLDNGQFDTAFHVFAVEWEEDEIRWYMDDSLYQTITPGDLDGDEWVFDHPFYIILNVAVGGNFVGPPDASTIFPQTMLIDYVRVYQSATPADTCCQVRGNADGISGPAGPVDVTDLSYLIDFLFRGGPPTLCEEEGNVNGVVGPAGPIDISDLSFLVDYLFREGPEPPECPASQAGPLIAAPAPTADAAEVISLFCDVYTDHPVDTWSAVGDVADVADYLIGTDNTKKYSNLVFALIEFRTTTVNASEMSHFHMDVWTPDATASASVFKVKLVDFGANGVYNGGGEDDVEGDITFDESTMNTGSWVSLDMPLAGFSGLTTKEHLAQLIISGDPTTLSLDNVYLYDGGVPQAPAVPAPLPTVDAADVVSLFSDAYPNHPVDTWSADWDMADVADYSIGADNTKKYTNLIFAGIEFSTTTVDAAAMTHFHIDIWTPDETAAPSVFKIKLVDFGADGVYGGGDDVEHEITLDDNTMNTGSWTGIELPLTDFTNLTAKEHLAQLLISGDLNTVYVDNVYFHR